MTATSESTDDPHATRASSTTETRYRRIAACVDDSAVTGKVIGHAVAIANALGAELVLMHVVEPKESHGAPTDPVEWNLRRREASSHVEMLARDRADEVEAIHATVVEGHAAEQICIWARDHRVDLTVVGTSGEGHAREWELGSTARRVVDSAPGSVLLVPACVEDAPSIHYRRLLVPLDGSSRAESALPIALRVAEAENAEIVLAHAV
ncbi:MAG: universal stress protein, partial [Gammaproteobacteria bacterium]